MIKKSDQDKPWNRRKCNSKSYALASEPIAKTFLIVCEGANTEPEYFKAFPVVTAQVEVVGAGRVRTSLIEEAIRLMKIEDNKGREVWCVFDYDNKPDDATLATDFHNALQLAARKGIHVAWSNDAIELWFVLHHQYLQNALTRHQYYSILEDVWNLPESYERSGKQKVFCSSLYRMLLPYQLMAINHARRLYDQQDETKPIAQWNPCTTVFMLVEELNRYLRK